MSTTAVVTRGPGFVRRVNGQTTNESGARHARRDVLIAH